MDEVLHAASDYEIDNKNGPLWAVKFLPWSENQREFVKLTSCTNGTIEEPKREYYSHVIIYSYHTISDGYTIARTMRTLLHFLNENLAGRVVDDSVPAAKLLDPSREENLLLESESFLSSNPEILEERGNYFRSCYKGTLLEKAFPVAPNIKPHTSSKYQLFDENSTSIFISRCKQEKITVHCAFSTLIDAAVVKVLIEGGFKDDSYKISCTHCADNRVYYGYDNCHYEFGLGMGMFAKITEYTDSVFTDFWKVARDFQTEFKKLHALKFAHQGTAIEKLTKQATIGILDSKGQEKPYPKMLEYCTTNMRNINGIYNDDWDQISLEFVNVLSTVYLYPILWISSFHTLNGKLSHSFQYSGQLISAETSQKILDAIYDLFLKVIN